MIESNRMTAGSPAKHILKLAFPLMLGNIFQQLYTIVDTAVVGKALGVNALAALGTTEWMIFLMVGAIQGITHGFSVVVAQRFGNKEEEGVRAAVICALALTLAFFCDIYGGRAVSYLSDIKNYPCAGRNIWNGKRIFTYYLWRDTHNFCLPYDGFGPAGSGQQQNTA